MTAVPSGFPKYVLATSNARQQADRSRFTAGGARQAAADAAAAPSHDGFPTAPQSISTARPFAAM
ncbi:hypothetical protein [Nocardia sp. NPDC019255]|uniref:hypothetical protein n=1 Tax=unclassified Nocardia TaxID=2637762 RepID=UPI0033D61081